MAKLTLQVFIAGKWQDAALLDIPEPDTGRAGRATLGYEPPSYALEWMEHDDEHAISLNCPVDLMQTYRSKPWFSFLDDIMPAGASRRYWVRHLDIAHLPPAQQDFILLKEGAIAPVGNVRIKESVPEPLANSQLAAMRFSINDVVERDSDFMQYAQQLGAAAGGATGAGGEAPKLLLRASPKHEIWIDTYQNDLHNQDQHYLVKFPRGNRIQDDCDILRAEYHFYHELAALGQDTISTEKMKLIEGERYPSLWLPRFDVSFTDGTMERYGLESVYSVLNKQPGTSLNHFSVIESLIKKLETQFAVIESKQAFDRKKFVIEWVKRDLLNVVFGNSDNHGRNTSLIKRPSGIWLSPIYDFAPMKADPEGVTRSTTWGSPFEEGGRFDWTGIAKQLNNYVTSDELISELKRLATQLTGLRERLETRGVSTRLLNMPTLQYEHLDTKLKNWQLL
jgi:serine/threonine-protein kinase HipA